MQPRHRRYKTFFTFLPFYTAQRDLQEILLKVNLIHLEDQLKVYLYGDTSTNNASPVELAQDVGKPGINSNTMMFDTVGKLI